MTKSILKRQLSDEGGHVAVFFALLAVPLLVLSSAAIDMNKANKVDERLSAALDSAAMSAVTNQLLDEDERATFAEDIFWSNIGDTDLGITLDVLDSSSSKVELTASAKVNTLFLSTKGQDSYTVAEKATAELTYGDVICMLALDPDGERSFEISHGSRLKAHTCSVQVNSTHPSAAVIKHGGEAFAKDFCISGGTTGTTGKFVPHVNTECGQVEDPFKSKRAPAPGVCVDPIALDRLLSSWQAESVGVTLQPGTYCDGLDLNNKKVTFAPGTYIIKDGPFILDIGTRAHAEDVTFVMQGVDAILQANEGSRAYFKAPKTGPYAGLAFFQDVHTDAKNFKS